MRIPVRLMLLLSLPLTLSAEAHEDIFTGTTWELTFVAMVELVGEERSIEVFNDPGEQAPTMLMRFRDDGIVETWFPGEEQRGSHWWVAIAEEGKRVIRISDPLDRDADVKTMFYNQISTTECIIVMLFANNDGLLMPGVIRRR